MRTPLLVGAAALATVLTTARPAHACYGDECTAREKAWNRMRFEGGVGLLAGGYSVGPVSGAAIGTHLDGGVRSGRLAVLGEYDFVSIGQSEYDHPDPIRGQLHRLGANLRYSVGAFGGRTVPIRGDIWIEGGLGDQFVHWNGGGELERRDVAFGFGGQMTVQLGEENPRYLGFYYAFRGMVARDPDESKEPAMPTCAGPCDRPTGPSSWDLGAFFNFGVVFSR
ncbi:MAG TPA: hypothetical protein VHE35_09085 [Kofleriaceae bacterium]|nr:hypothetical protein [Kofleriaceae bacterium]